MRAIYFFFMAFGLVWAPYIDIGLGYFGDSQILFAALLIGVSGYAPWRRAPSPVKHIVVWLLLLVVYSALMCVGYKKLLYVPILRIGRAAVIFYASWCLIYMLYESKTLRGTRIVLYALYAGFVVHALLMLAQFVYPQLREWMEHWTFAGGGLEINRRTRMPGLTNGGGAQVSVYESMGFVFFPFCYVLAERYMAKVLLSVGIAAIAFAIILSGRSGVYTVAVFVPIAVIWLGIKVRKTGGVIAYLIRLFALVASIATMALVIGLVDHYLRVGSAGDYYVNYAFGRNLDMLLDPDQNLVRNDTVTELLTNDLVLPTQTRVLWIGDLGHMDLSQGVGGAVARDLDSDIGYVRLLFAYGIIGSALQYAVYVYMIVVLWRRREEAILLSGLGIILFVMILVFQAKEIFVFTRIGWSICSLVYCAGVGLWRREETLPSASRPERVRNALRSVVRARIPGENMNHVRHLRNS